MRQFAKITSLSLITASAIFAGSYDYSDSIAASRTHPGKDSIGINQVPMFISFGWDDNGIADKSNNGGATWIRNYLKEKTNPVGNNNPKTFDGSPMRSAFYFTAKYGREWVYENYPDVREVWNNLYTDGHEVGNHSTTHLGYWDAAKQEMVNFDGREYTKEEYLEKEIDTCHSLLIAEYSKTSSSKGIGIAEDDIIGWRNPRLEWNDAVLSAIVEKGYVYDCSMELETFGDGTDFYWPHTLNDGSPVHDNVTSHPGLWEMPAYRFVIPQSLRGEDKVGDSIMTGLDYNVWAPKAWGALELTGPEFTEILNYNLDQRMAGNRCPMLIGVHSDIYSSKKDSDYPGTASARSRQEAIENFIDYATTTYPDVRIVTPYQVIQWMREPIALENGSSVKPSSKTISEIRINSMSAGEVSLTVPQSGMYTVSLFQLDGTIVSEKSVSLLKNKLVSVQMKDNLSKGTYFVKISDGTNVTNHKVTQL